MNKFFLTTAIDYSSGVGHIGNDYEKILADCVARYHRLIGDETYFLTGTDDHGQKVESEAEKAKKTPAEFAKEVTEDNQKELATLNISYDRFIRTEDADHKKFCEEFFLKSKANGDIYEAEYEGLYCVGCEEVKNKSDLVNGHCPIHPTRELEPVKEKNYFFRFSKYQEFLEKHFEENPEFVQPELRHNEALSFLQKGLVDIPVSRASIKWGIPVPGDPSQVIYVWFDALINYLTVGVEEKIWPADVHFIGKDINRFHTLLWPAMLKSAGYELPKKVYVHGFISLNGDRISKSSGNVLYASDLVKKYGSDAIRYFFLRNGPIVDDTDFTLEKIQEAYNADLANGLGNLVARIAKLSQGIDISKLKIIRENNLFPNVSREINNFRADKALELIWLAIRGLDGYLERKRPWEKTNLGDIVILSEAVTSLLEIVFCIQPFLPKTAGLIQEQFSGKIRAGEPLFPRIK